MSAATWTTNPPDAGAAGAAEAAATVGAAAAGAPAAGGVTAAGTAGLSPGFASADFDAAEDSAERAADFEGAGGTGAALPPPVAAAPCGAVADDADAGFRSSTGGLRFSSRET